MRGGPLLGRPSLLPAACRRTSVRFAWLIDPLMRTVTAHTPVGHPRLFTDADDLVGNPALPGLRIPADVLHAPLPLLRRTVKEVTT